LSVSSVHRIFGSLDSILKSMRLRAIRKPISELRATTLGKKFVHRHENFFYTVEKKGVAPQECCFANSSLNVS